MQRVRRRAARSASESAAGGGSNSTASGSRAKSRRRGQDPKSGGPAQVPVPVPGSAASSLAVQPGSAGAAPSASERVGDSDDAELAEERECILCMNAPRQTRLQPCRHVLLCEPCAAAQRDWHRARHTDWICPLCQCVASLVSRYDVGDFGGLGTFVPDDKLPPGSVRCHVRIR